MYRSLVDGRRSAGELGFRQTATSHVNFTLNREAWLTATAAPRLLSEPPPMRLLLFLLFVPLSAALPAQADSLLRAFHWEEEGTERRLLFTPDGTFQLDYGSAEGRGRYLLGRYRTGSTGRELILSVDYFLGKSRLHARYREGRDYYLVYDIVTINEERLVLLDVATDDLLAFCAAPLSGDDDPVRRQLPKPKVGDWKLPEGWGGSKE